ncbi:glycosyltransferase [Reinekea marinisedimentorum]|uniref:Glycosyltransferase involved in cell wall biosynthesis n=1 Tax=Reinekea marinisedimentorum TaxID=230495 RepID=A0A4R3I978_9GAMM|nr:glycosyltransferase [Reinekea marinisedimentorum]TCS41923.1 glycosyltransferase involved in cell wall biosynthesis [Reinekea marinisedimentorum]
MAVIHITSRADQGGGPEHVKNLVEGLISNGVDCYIACPPDKPYYQVFSDLVGKINVIEIPHRKFEVRALLGLVSFVRKNNITIVHSHGKGAGVYSRLLRLFCKSKIVHTFHGFHVGEYGKFKKAVYACYESLLSLLTDRFICVSNTELQQISDYLPIKIDKKTSVVVNGVDSTVVSNEVDCERHAIYVVSRYDYQKNTKELIEALYILKEEHISPKVVIYGDGEGKCEIQGLCRKYSLDNVRLAGNVKSPRSNYSDAKVFINTSRWEGLPFAPLEAMAEGVPCILSNVTGNRELIRSGEGGWLYESGNVRELSSLIKASLKLEGVAWQKMSDDAKVVVEGNYSKGLMVKETLNTYRLL